MERVKREITTEGKGPFIKKNGQVTDDGLFDDVNDYEAERKYDKLQKMRDELDKLETEKKNRLLVAVNEDLNECIKKYK